MNNAKPTVNVMTQLLSAAAVVLSLVFVGLEVRESARQTALNTQSVQVSAYQDLLSQIMGLNMMSMENPGSNTPSTESSLGNLSPLEREREISRNIFIIRHGDLAYYQYELGMLPEERLESALGMLNDNLCSPLLLETWMTLKDNFVPSYQAFIDRKFDGRGDC